MANLRSFHIFGAGGTAQAGAGTINSVAIEATPDRTLSILGKVTKTGGTLAATARVQVSNATEDEVIRSGFTEEWFNEESLAAQTIPDATTEIKFKITKAVFRRYRVQIVFTDGNSTTVARAAGG